MKQGDKGSRVMKLIRKKRVADYQGCMLRGYLLFSNISYGDMEAQDSNGIEQMTMVIRE